MEDNHFASDALPPEVAVQFLGHAESLSNFGCFEWDIRANKVRWSDGLFEIYGLRPQEFTATLEAFMERVVPEDREHVQASIQAALSTGEPFTCVERIVHSSGEIRFLESRGEVVVDEHGQPTKLIGVCTDVTTTKNLERQLRHSQKMEAVGRLAAGVAHDFNNLLTVIHVNSELLDLNPGLNESAKRATASINDAAQRATNLTSQLLMFGRKSSPKEISIDLNQRIKSSEELLSSLLGNHIKLSLDLESSIDNIQFDASHLDQLLVNLSVNARDAMTAGGTLTIQTHTESLLNSVGLTADVPAGAYVVLSVRDTGHGMTDQECDRVFDPFYSTKPPGKGTGLGLAVVYGVVRDAGGAIRLSSEVSKGTQFQIYFPASPSTQKTETQVERRAEGGPQTILVCEDDALVRQATCDALRNGGYVVMEAIDGEAALSTAERVDGEFDLLLTDIVMPGIQGHELAEIVTQRYPHVRVLCVSGFSETNSADSQYKRLRKPYSIDTLINAVRQQLQVGSVEPMTQNYQAKVG